MKRELPWMCHPLPSPNLLHTNPPRCLSFHRSAAIPQVVGSSELLGNPVGLVSTLGSGVVDLFYEPAKGLALGPREFAAGLGRGAASALKKSIFAVFNTASKVGQNTWGCGREEGEEGGGRASNEGGLGDAGTKARGQGKKKTELVCGSLFA